jgi:hypothetical protein
MEPRTIRVFWRNRTSDWVNFNWDGVITPQSVVHISACECKFPEGGIFGAESVILHRGLAPIWVKNVRVHGPNPGDTITGGVEFFIQVDWDTPLDVATDITVMGTPEDKAIVG